MELSELKLISASNIINLRTSAGMTQAELGAKLNYSDKTISKWERAEAIPDAYVLTQIAELFNVDVNYLLSSHVAWERPTGKDDPEPVREITYNANVIIAVAILGVMTLALAVFVTLWIMGRADWRVFLVGVTISVLVFMILQCCFNKGRYLRYIISALVLLLLTDGYFIVPEANIWQIFLIAFPAIVIVFLSFRIKKKQAKIPQENEFHES